MDILLNYEKVDTFSALIPIQTFIGAKIKARESISAMRKDVTAKC
jgi:translation elongation factor EF-4